MEKEVLKYLVEYVQSVSPELWKITLDYIYAAAMQWIVGAVFFLIVAASFLAFEKLNKESDGTFYLVALAMLIPVFVCAGNAIGRLASPEMYAIKYLLSMVP